MSLKTLKSKLDKWLKVPTLLHLCNSVWSDRAFQFIPNRYERFKQRNCNAPGAKQTITIFSKLL